MSTQLADALNDKNNVTKTIKAGGAVPIDIHYQIDSPGSQDEYTK